MTINCPFEAMTVTHVAHEKGRIGIWNIRDGDGDGVMEMAIGMEIGDGDDMEIGGGLVEAGGSWPMGHGGEMEIIGD